MRQKFTLRILNRSDDSNSSSRKRKSRGKRAFNPDTKAKAVVVRELQRSKEEEIERAVAYCTENNVHGWAAISAGICPSIKDPRTIDGLMRIMTEYEEEWKEGMEGMEGSNGWKEGMKARNGRKKLKK